MSTAIVYGRVSTDDQALSPEGQQGRCADYAERNGLSVVGCYFDHGVSGAAPLDARPELMAAIDALPEGGVLLVAKRDRLARDTMAAAMIERLVGRKGARIESADGVGNGDSPEALLMRRMVDAFAEYERAIIRARTKAALKVKRDRGERLGRPRYGYRVEAGELVPYEPEQRVLRLVAELREDGLSVRQIVEALEARGVSTSTGRAFCGRGVRRLLAA
jgi:DNA invertase Pin-like site-specific DNA recombinase